LAVGQIRIIATVRKFGKTGGVGGLRGEPLGDCDCGYGSTEAARTITGLKQLGIQEIVM